jgi:hypothetical protein
MRHLLDLSLLAVSGVNIAQPCSPDEKGGVEGVVKGASGEAETLSLSQPI